MKKKINILYLFAIYITGVSSGLCQKIEIPEGYFGSPVKHAIKLGGNFCELRNNHFHAGIDIKSSRGVVGDSLFAVADGYIDRIKVQRSSYGQTIYIDHPVGLTSVYAHMDRFAPDIEAYVKKNQYEQKSFEVDLYPDSLRFGIKRGQFIGWMGNKGYSLGPHLHFELRTTKEEIPQNPMQYGIGTSDVRRPVFTAMKVAQIDHRGKPLVDNRYKLKKIAAGRYRTLSDTIVVDSWRAGVEVGCFDRQDGSWNKNGVYELLVVVDSDTLFVFRADHCSFDETHQLNAHINYKDRVLRNQFIHRCYKLPGSTLSMYPRLKNLGHIKVYAGRSQQVKILAKDLAGNESEITFYIKRKSQVTPSESETYHSLFLYDKNNVYSFGEITIKAEQGSLYHDLGLRVESMDEIGQFRIGDATIALKEDLELRLPESYEPEGPREKIHLQYFDARRKRWKSMGRSKVDGSLVFNISHLGTFWLTIDTTPPYIRPVVMASRINRPTVLKFKIGDEMSVVRAVDNIRYEVRLNDEWILAEFDAKSDLLTIPLDPKMAEGTAELNIAVEDFCGNVRTYEARVVFIPNRS